MKVLFDCICMANYSLATKEAKFFSQIGQKIDVYKFDKSSANPIRVFPMFANRANPMIVADHSGLSIFLSFIRKEQFKHFLVGNHKTLQS